MAPEREGSGRAWLALRCARDGTIRKVLRDDFGVAERAKRLTDIVDVHSVEKAENFIASLDGRDCCVGWQLHVPAAAGTRPLYFAGARSGDDTLTIFATSAAEAIDNDLYDELSRLNNDLINREREIARKSAALERVSAEKSRLMAIAAHDLRNPLTVVASYADLLRMDSNLGEDHLAYVDEISRSARFMMELVEEMLDSARFESGHVELELKDVDLVKAAHHAAAVNRLRAERKLIAIAFESDMKRAIIRADPVKLRQIVNNLIVNAIKFSPSHTTTTVRVRLAGERVALEVEDQGIGIAKEDLQAIFEPFKIASVTGTAGEKSTGLGLSIVKQLAEMHGATVEVESEEGRGSVFRVAFPIAV